MMLALSGALARPAATATQRRANGPRSAPVSRLLLRRSRPARLVAADRRVMAAVKEIVVDSNPSEAKLKELGVRSWPTWGCEASKFPWSYDSTETCYVLEGQVFVTPDGGEPVEVKAGDMATFPKGMSCTWDVKKAIRKHYNFE